MLNCAEQYKCKNVKKQQQQQQQTNKQTKKPTPHPLSPPTNPNPQIITNKQKPLTHKCIVNI